MWSSEQASPGDLAAVTQQMNRVWPGIEPMQVPGPGIDAAFEGAVQVYGGRERAPRGQFAYFTKGAHAYVNAGSDPLEFIAIAAREAPAASAMLQSVAFAQWTLERGAQLGRISDFGEPWVPGSNLDHLYFSLPYILPTDMWHVTGTASAHWCWVVPISRREATYGREHGTEALEVALESAAAPIGAMSRASVV